MTEKEMSSTDNGNWEKQENWRDNDRMDNDFKEKVQLRISGNPYSSFQYSDSTNQYTGSYPRIKISVDAIKSNNLQNPQFINNFSNYQNIENITAFLISNIEVFIETVSSDIPKDLLTALLKLIAKACESMVVTSKIWVLKSTLQEKFVRSTCSFLVGIKVNDRRYWQFRENFGNILSDILTILENSIQFVPNSWKHLKSIINTITFTLPDIQQNKDIQLPEDCEKKIAFLRQSIQEIAVKESAESDIEENDILFEIYDKIDEGDPDDDETLNNEKVLSKKGFLKENTKSRINTIQRSIATNRHVALNPKLKVHLNSVKFNNFQSPNVLNDISKNQSAEEITVFLISDIKVYSQIISTDITEELLKAILKLIAKSCAITYATNKSCVLKSTFQKKFVNSICSFLSGLIVDETKDNQFWHNFADVLNNILTILENAMQFIPMTTWEYLTTIVKTITLVLPVLQKSQKIELPENFNSRVASLKEDIQKIKMKFEKVSKPTLDQNTALCQADDDSDQNEPDCDYRTINVFPEINELINPDRPFLRKNNIKGKYTSLQHYLDVHFRLMREDFINPIREDICDYLNHIKRKLFNIKVHEKVFFLNKNIENDLICFRLKIEISQSLQDYIQTRQNKRFMHGTLLFFSTDNFQSMFCGRVVSSNDLKNGILFVNLPDESYIDYTKDYSMIECIVFFEPYYQVLNALQALSYQQLPMEKYLLQLETNILPPKYMKNVTNLKIPSGLNSSQKNALDAALNKELVIIQGPPGTGKTFVGRTMVEVLLQHKECWQNTGPMLVLCYTNHALDQFLGGLYFFKLTEKIMRLGGKSKNLFEITKKFGPKGLLKSYLEREHGIYVDDNDEDFNLLVRSLRDTYIEELRFCDPSYYDAYDSVPAYITQWLREKYNVSSIFITLKRVEDDIYEVHKEILKIVEKEKYGILANIICEWDFQKFEMTEYRFQNFELFCWLLCDDGTVFSKQNEKVTIFENSIVEQDKIYTLLFNFILGNLEDNNGYTNYLSVHSLLSIADELKGYLKIKTNQIQRRYLKEQFDFLLNKIEYLKLCLKTDFGNPELELGDYSDPFAIPSKHRWQLYKHWVELYKTGLEISLDNLYEHYRLVNDNYNDRKKEENIRLFKTMDIIGMTTTCAARLRSTLEQLSSPIVIVEEAAEVLESHIITALTKDCQHLILLGDHQQLRPTTSDYTIAKKYNLGISLFERMILNNIECHTLNVQHRMRPEISGLISPLFYKELFNHPSVEMYPLVSGIGSPVYFIDHTEPEEPYLESSKMNMHEAKFLIELAIYLLNNNYEPADITILAAYRGQSYILQQEQKKSKHIGLQRVRIAVVDNFQGEENKIILLSLVRNNSDKKVGFLSIDNRVCVALSRAKEGLYIMGNMTHLCEASNIWKSIRANLEAQQAIGTYLPLHCKNHTGHITLVSKPNDFSKVPAGGCNQSCDALLECGHNCIKICHGYDVDHKLYNCEKPCLRLLCDNPDHKCKKICFEKCGPCHYPVSRKLNCGHEITLPCTKNININYKCLESIETHPKCGHQANIPCHTLDSHRCLVLVEFTPPCGHTQNISCFRKSLLTKVLEKTNSDALILVLHKCLVSVEFTPQCGHTQNISCFEKALRTKSLNETESDAHTCLELVEFTPQCGHTQKILCSEKLALTKALDETKSDADTLVLHKCLELVEFTPQCGHTQNISCFEKSSLALDETKSDARKLVLYKCLVLVEFTPQCGHTQNISCFKKSSLTKALDETKSDAHTCLELVEFTPQCGHTQKILCFEKSALTKALDETKSDADALVLHKCLEFVEFTPQCGHTQNIWCFKKSELSKGSNKTEADAHDTDTRFSVSLFCKVKTEKRIPKCGHYQTVACSEDLTAFKCQAVAEITLRCGHKKEKLCCLKERDVTCSNDCGQILKCGHKCPRKCHVNDDRFHTGYKCMEPCNKNLNGCRNPEKHKKCSLLCYKDCEQCIEMVINSYENCSHIEITKCYESNTTCHRQCRKKLSCGHFCTNSCDEPCSSCEQKTFKKIPDCGHQIEVRCNENPLQINCKKPCTKTLDCGHNCTKKCNEPCTTVCHKKCQKLLECGHDCIKSCHESCACKMEVSPYCGHSIPVKCGDVFFADQCEKVITKVLNCGHSQLTKCNEAIENLKCLTECEIILECGHRCQEKCGEPCTSLDKCKRLCNKMLNCNHSCKNMCHETCTDKCLERCTKELKCGHKCTKPCSSKCITFCNSKCNKILDCGHRCRKQCYYPCQCHVCKIYRY